MAKPLTAEDAEVLLAKQIDLARQMQQELQARRQRAAQEAAAQKAEEEKRQREEKRRKEAEELERAQAHAREVAAQSFKTPEPVRKQPEPAAKEATEDDSLEAMLAESLAVDLEDTTDHKGSGNKEEKAPAGKAAQSFELKPGDITRTARQTLSSPVPRKAAPQADAVQGKAEESTEPRRQNASQHAAQNAAPQTPHPHQPSAKEAKKDAVAFDLQSSLEEAVGSAAQEAVADMSGQEADEKKKARQSGCWFRLFFARKGEWSQIPPLQSVQKGR